MKLKNIGLLILCIGLVILYFFINPRSSATRWGLWPFGR